ncbi:hypothetical protein HME9304_00169 [Flagellimonas maritima]|uniref:AI-2E family transporter n=1 Tax=Flagellimonas maritima TaxID=1383885 RepID=A0A2Z4LMZ5_9FLAO|nr:AI-2E family transporter [Allomuricauda aurantiaca]AWX43182.1 hypothetical protein HME9304_00169 [Allomuricauda aurantiaca]
MGKISSLSIRQIFVLVSITVISILIFMELLPYFSGVLGAITFYVLLRKHMKKLLSKGLGKNFSALILMLFSLIAILLPFLGIVLMTADKIGKAVVKSEAVFKLVSEKLKNINDRLGVDIAPVFDSERISGFISDQLNNFAGGAFNATVSIAIMYFLLFYMLTNQKRLKETLFEYIPITDRNLNLIGSGVRQMVRANALGIPLVAIAQGIVALIGFLIFGINEPWFWALIVTIGSMIPFVGTAIGILPLFLLLLSNGQTSTAWAIFIYGFFVIGTTDNFIRLYILKRIDDVHPLITLIGVIIGIPMFGFIGLIFGPLLISLFLIIVKIYKNEYGI